MNTWDLDTVPGNGNVPKLDSSVLSITGHVVARVHLETLTAEAYAICFKTIFATVKKSHPEFAVGDSLKGVVVDWSDTQMAGLEAAVGKETASLIAKGCKVHFIRSVKRVSERINKGSSLARKAFTAIAYHIPKATTPEDVTTLFNVLAGEDVSEAATLMPECSVVQQCSQEHKTRLWQEALHWAEWWKRPRHLRK